MNQPILIDELDKSIISLTLDQAQEKYPTYTFRATCVDGVSLLVHDDFRQTRINVKITNGIISKFVGRY